MPWCISYWICGLYSNGMVVGRINKTPAGKATLTTDEPEAPQKSLEVRITSKLDIEDGDYGLAVVSCANTIVSGSYSNNGASPSSLSKKDIDLSKLEVIAFFSFMDPAAPKVRMSHERALEYFNTAFNEFVKKDDDSKKDELLRAYNRQTSSTLSYAGCKS